MLSDSLPVPAPNMNHRVGKDVLPITGSYDPNAKKRKKSKSPKKVMSQAIFDAVRADMGQYATPRRSKAKRVTTPKLENLKPKTPEVVRYKDDDPYAASEAELV